jgi:hypothetical protein
MGMQSMLTVGSYCAAGALALAATAAHAAQPIYANKVLADGATAYYGFDEGAGSTAFDAAGGDNNATYVNVALNQPSINGILGTAAGFTFNATTPANSSRVRIPDAATFDLGTGPVTVELWYRTTDDGRGDLFTYKGGGGDFGIHSNSQADPAGFDASASLYFNDFNASPNGANLGAWHHIAVTRDAASAVRFYVDGILRGNGTDSDTLNIANDILIGSNHTGDPGAPAIGFNGLIDEVAWYPVALTQAQIQNHVNTVPEPSAAGAALGALAVLVTSTRARRPPRVGR